MIVKTRKAVLWKFFDLPWGIHGMLCSMYIQLEGCGITTRRSSSVPKDLRASPNHLDETFLCFLQGTKLTHNYFREQEICHSELRQKNCFHSGMNQWNN